MTEPGVVEAAAPERLILVPVIRDEAGDRYVLVRWPDWPHPTMLSLAPPAANDSLEEAAGQLIRARLGLEATGAPARAEECIPVRMAAPRLGIVTTGWLRPVLQPVRGEPEPDALLEGAEMLTLEEAIAALSTEVERLALRGAAALARRT